MRKQQNKQIPQGKGLWHDELWVTVSYDTAPSELTDCEFWPPWFLSQKGMFAFQRIPSFQNVDLHMGNSSVAMTEMKVEH